MDSEPEGQETLHQPVQLVSRTLAFLGHDRLPTKVLPPGD